MPRRRIYRKPLNPLFIHSGEVRLLENDDCGTDNPFERSTCGFEDGRHILQALSGLLLNGIPNNLSGYGIVRPRARDEHKTRCPYKGEASYYSIRADAGSAENAIWTYEQPLADVAEIAGHMAFYPNRVDLIEELPA